MFVSDYDGTIADSNGIVSEETILQLKRVGELGVTRVIATGRSFYSFKRTVGNSFPIDYLICSSGAGVYDWKTMKILQKNKITEEDTKEIYNYLIKNNYDFMVQLPLPDNHFFHHFYSGMQKNQDFFDRIKNYEESGLKHVLKCPKEASQFVIIVPQENGQFNDIHSKFSGMKVLRATSPIDGRSFWIEILPNGISKVSGIDFISKKRNINIENIVVVGNDYYDLDMLKHANAQNAYVVANAPNELKSTFNVIGININEGVSELLKEIY